MLNGWMNACMNLYPQINLWIIWIAEKLIRLGYWWMKSIEITQRGCLMLLESLPSFSNPVFGMKSCHFTLVALYNLQIQHNSAVHRRTRLGCSQLSKSQPSQLSRFTLNPAKWTTSYDSKSKCSAGTKSVPWKRVLCVQRARLLCWTLRWSYAWNSSGMRKTHEDYEDISTHRLHCKNGSNFIQYHQFSAANPQGIISLTSSSLKRKHQLKTPTLLLTNLPSQAAVQHGEKIPKLETSNSAWSQGNPVSRRRFVRHRHGGMRSKAVKTKVLLENLEKGRIRFFV